MDIRFVCVRKFSFLVVFWNSFNAKWKTFGWNCGMQNVVVQTNCTWSIRYLAEWLIGWSHASLIGQPWCGGQEKSHYCIHWQSISRIQSTTSIALTQCLTVLQRTLMYHIANKDLFRLFISSLLFFLCVFLLLLSSVLVANAFEYMYSPNIVEPARTSRTEVAVDSEWNTGKQINGMSVSTINPVYLW